MCMQVKSRSKKRACSFMVGLGFSANKYKNVESNKNFSGINLVRFPICLGKFGPILQQIPSGPLRKNSMSKYRRQKFYSCATASSEPSTSYLKPNSSGLRIRTVKASRGIYDMRRNSHLLALRTS